MLEGSVCFMVSCDVGGLAALQIHWGESREDHDRFCRNTGGPHLESPSSYLAVLCQLIQGLECRRRLMTCIRDVGQAIDKVAVRHGEA